MYFTDRLSAPTSSFIPPPVTETGGAGYMPDCTCLSQVLGPVPGPKGLSLTCSAPIMVSSRRPRDLSRKRRLGNDSSYTPYPNRRSTGPLEIPNHHHSPFNLFKPLATPRSRSSPHLFTRRTIIRYPPNRSPKPNYRFRVTSRQSSSYSSRIESNGGDQD